MLSKIAKTFSSKQSLSTTDQIQNAMNDYFDLKNSSWGMTALKVISDITLVIPVLLFAIKTFLECVTKTSGVKAQISVISPLLIPLDLATVIDASPAFNGCKIGKGTPYEGTCLTNATIRPANLLYQALLGPDYTTMPGSGKLFSFTIPHDQVRRAIEQAQVVNGTANGLEQLGVLYGNGTYRITGQELRETLDSQTIACAPLLPKEFYRGLKEVMMIEQEY